jgi:hypothetical protein
MATRTFDEFEKGEGVGGLRYEMTERFPSKDGRSFYGVVEEQQNGKWSAFIQCGLVVIKRFEQRTSLTECKSWILTKTRELEG